MFPKLTTIFAGICLFSTACDRREQPTPTRETREAKPDMAQVEPTTTPMPKDPAAPIPTAVSTPAPTAGTHLSGTSKPVPKKDAQQEQSTPSDAPSSSQPDRPVAGQELSTTTRERREMSEMTPAPDLPGALNAASAALSAIPPLPEAITQKEAYPVSLQMEQMARLVQEGKYTDEQKQGIGRAVEVVDKLMGQAMSAKTPNERREYINTATRELNAAKDLVNR